MQINLPEGIENQSVAAGYASVDQYIYSLVQRDRERLAIQVGIDALKGGRTEDFEQFDQKFRKANALAQ